MAHIGVPSKQRQKTLLHLLGAMLPPLRQKLHEVDNYEGRPNLVWLFVQILRNELKS